MSDFFDLRTITILSWLAIVVFFRPRFQISAIFALTFFLLSALTSFLAHHGFALRMSTYGFWFILIGLIQALMHQISDPSLTEGGRLSLSKRMSWITSVGVLLVIFTFYFRWFTLQIHVGGDLPYFYLANLKDFFGSLIVWQSYGLGVPSFISNWKYPIDLVLGFFSTAINFHFEILEKLVFFLPFLAISLGSVYFFARVFKLSLLFFLFSVTFFLTNTYLLLLTSGGQMLFALAVALYPAVFAIFHQAVAQNSWFKRVLAAVFLAILTVFDPRVTYLALIAIFLYYLFLLIVSPGKRKNLLINFSKIFLAVFPIFLGLLAYWWLPLVLTRDLGLPSGFGSVSQVRELSFAVMSNTVTTFQPFWPENIFGKLHPTPFYFFLVPILTFTSILFRPKDKLVLFFSALALVGIFLAKGANEPLGEIYLFLNQFLPGFAFFRDPTKFYVLIVFSYSFLLAIFVQEILQRIKKDHLRYGFLIIFIGFLVFLSKEAILGQVAGTFEAKNIPAEYKTYAETLSEDKRFYRTFWLPTKFVFAYGDNYHPEVMAWDLTLRPPISSFVRHFYHTFSYLDSPAAGQFFDILGVRYLFVLNVSEQKFQNEGDRKGTEKSQNRLIASLVKKDWLTPVNFFKNAEGFENKNFSDRFWLVDKVAILEAENSVYETLASLPDFDLKNFAFLSGEAANLGDFFILENPKETSNQNLPTILIYNLDSDQKNSTEIFVPRKDRYQISVRTFQGELPNYRQEEIPYGQIQSYLWQTQSVQEFEEGRQLIKIGLKNADRLLLIPDNLTQILTQAKIGNVDYRQINPTKYKVKIDQSPEGKILIFSESFHPKWSAFSNGAKINSMPVYGLINGFPLTQNLSEVTVEFEPQRLVIPSLAVSIFSTIFVVSTLLFLKIKRQ